MKAASNNLQTAEHRTESDPLLPIKDEKRQNSNERGHETDKKFKLCDTLARDDAIDILTLAVPIFVAAVSWIVMKTTDTALLGHVGTEYLSASALSDLYTMCTGVLIRGRILGILCSQAVGAGNYKLAGVYLQVSLFVLSIVAVGVFVSWLFTEQIWVAFGQEMEISKAAGYYAKALAFSIPGQVVFSQLSQYFSAQRIMHPEVTTSLIAMTLNLLLGLTLVLGIAIPNFSGFQFVACPIVTTVVLYIQIILLWYVYCVRQRLHENCWGGWSWRDITKDRVKTFCGLYFPAALGLASDFWRMGVIGAMAARLGEVEVGVFNTSYRIIWIVIVFTSSIASAAGIKMGVRLGGGDPLGAKRAGHVGVFMSLVILFVLCVAMSSYIRELGEIFTTDEEFLDLFEECRLPFIATIFAMNLAVAIEKVPISMGRTGEVFWMGFVGSWFGQVPASYVLIKYWRNDLFGLYSGVALGYALLVILYSILALTSDWHKYSRIAVQRSETS